MNHGFRVLDTAHGTKQARQFAARPWSLQHNKTASNQRHVTQSMQNIQYLVPRSSQFYINTNLITQYINGCTAITSTTAFG
jgi:hypothetical protein